MEGGGWGLGGGGDGVWRGCVERVCEVSMLESVM